MIHPFSKYNGTTIEVREWISNFILHYTGHVIIYPRLELKLIRIIKRGPCRYKKPTSFLVYTRSH